MSIVVGTQLIAPEGLEALEKGVDYYFLWSDPVRERVLLVYFVQRDPKPKKTKTGSKKQTPTPLPVLIAVRRALFEDAIDDKITKAPNQRTLPPWLDGLDLSRQSPKQKEKGEKRINGYLKDLKPALASYAAIRGDEDPEAALNRFAKRCTPPQNELRYRLRFFAYIVFKRNPKALHYPSQRIGRWDRFEFEGKLFGRGSKRLGHAHGHGSNDAKLLEDVYKGFKRYGKLGVSMAEVARSILVHIWGCRSVVGPDGLQRFVQPDGKPILNPRQIARRILEHFGSDYVRQKLYGKARHRRRRVESLGPFTEAVANVMERVEADAYWVDEVARGPVKGTHLPPLIVVRIRDTASGLIVGIGFSLGGETGDAFRMAQFCMAIGKVAFCRLFGIEISEEEWPSAGLSPNTIVDRGAGATAKGAASTPNARPVFAEMTPSYSGQSKAIIETSNPRSIHIEGPPTFFETDLPLIHLARREIRRAIADNDAMNVSNRLTDRMIAKRVRGTPLGIWNALDSVGRNDAIPQEFAEAVRAFLTPIKLKLEHDGVYLDHRRFDSPALRETGVLKRRHSDQDVTLEGFMLDMALRHVWVEINGAVVQVDAMVPLREDREQLYVSISELHAVAQLRRELQAGLPDHSNAVRGEQQHRFKEESGHDWRAGRRKRGRPKRGTASARKEAAATKRAVIARRKAA